MAIRTPGLCPGALHFQCYPREQKILRSSFGPFSAGNSRAGTCGGDDDIPEHEQFAE